MFLKSSIFWRIIEPIILGSIVNIVVNYIFDPFEPDFILEEFLVAIVLAIPITEINHFISQRLDRKFNWTNHFALRFLYHLIYLTIALLIVLNVLGNLYIWIIGDDFYSLNEILIINLSVFVIALLLTIFQWLFQFYKNWQKAEINFQNTNEELYKIKSELEKGSQELELQKGNSTLRINIGDIKYVKSEFGIVWVYYNNDKAVFNSSLSSLSEYLPKKYFFQANRNAIISRDSVLSFSNSIYGKIDLQLKELYNENQRITISRLKASRFRKWYNSTSG